MSGPSELRDTGWPSFLNISCHNCRFTCYNWYILYLFKKKKKQNVVRPIARYSCIKYWTFQYLNRLGLLSPTFIITIILDRSTILSLQISSLNLQEIQMKFMDGRIKLMNEILNGIKILKFYAWEKAFLEQVLGYREKELKALKKSQILYSISIASFNSSSFLVCSRDNNYIIHHFADFTQQYDITKHFFPPCPDRLCHVWCVCTHRWQERLRCSEDFRLYGAHQHPEDSSEPASFCYEHHHAGATNSINNIISNHF